MESSTKNFLFGLLLVVFVSVVHGNGFSVNLIDRDHSPLSPSYNPSQTPFERLKNAIARSTNRVNSFIKPSLSSDSTIQSSVAAAGGAYLMKYSLGTPPREILGIADTGSDLTWTQCEPCGECFRQKGPIFDSKESSSYKEMSCISRPCVDLILGSTSCSANKCTYSYTYNDGSYTFGNVASETFTFDTTSGRSVQIPNVSFGCGHNNAGTIDSGGSGIVGLGGGPLSLTSQLGSTIDDGKFSYCLIPLTPVSGAKPAKTSTLNFGSAAELTGDDVVSTPLVKKSPITFYYLTLEGISVGRGNDSTRVDFKQSKSLNLAAVGDAEEGNIVIDSGTTLTYLPEEFYQELVDKVKSVIDGEITASTVPGIHLCYQAKEDLKLPYLTVHFSGADLELEPVNAFLQINDGMCFTFTTGQDVSIYGNVAQANFLVEHDLKNSVVKFKKTDCTMH